MTNGRLTGVQRGRERALTIGLATGIPLACALLGVGVWSQSLTLFADALRASLLVVLDVFVLVVLRRIHRSRLPRYQYGFGKLEHFLNLLVGAALVLGAAWVIVLAAVKWTRVVEAPAVGLTGAAVMSAVNMSQNALMLFMIWRAGRDGTSIIVNGQIRARLTKLLSSVVSTLAILASAIFAGRESGLIADLFGSAFVVSIMLWTASRLIGAAIPDLLDSMLDEAQQAAINTALIRRFHAYDRVTHVRSRRSGNTVFVEIGLGYDADRRMGDVDAVNRAVTRDIQDLIPGVSVSIVAAACRPDDDATAAGNEASAGFHPQSVHDESRRSSGAAG